MRLELAEGLFRSRPQRQFACPNEVDRTALRLDWHLPVLTQTALGQEHGAHQSGGVMSHLEKVRHRTCLKRHLLDAP